MNISDLYDLTEQLAEQVYDETVKKEIAQGKIQKAFDEIKESKREGLSVQIFLSALDENIEAIENPEDSYGDDESWEESSYE